VRTSHGDLLTFCLHVFVLRLKVQVEGCLSEWNGDFITTLSSFIAFPHNVNIFVISAFLFLSQYVDVIRPQLYNTVYSLLGLRHVIENATPTFLTFSIHCWAIIIVVTIIRRVSPAGNRQPIPRDPLPAVSYNMICWHLNWAYGP